MKKFNYCTFIPSYKLFRPSSKLFTKQELIINTIISFIFWFLLGRFVVGPIIEYFTK